jgi:preprotein translocase subunit SecA
VLVGTVSAWRRASTSPTSCAGAGIPHEVLNAKQHEREARSSPRPAARAPSPSRRIWPAEAPTSCSAATPSSWRCAAEAPRPGPGGDPEEYEAAWDDALAEAEKQVEAEHDEVIGLGGLYVLGTERHESRRIDNQLRVGPVDRVTRGSRASTCRCRTTSCGCSTPASSTGSCRRRGWTTRSPSRQDAVPLDRERPEPDRGQNYEIRKNVLKYDDVLNRQRQVVYDERRSVLEGAGSRGAGAHFITDVVAAMSTPRRPRASPRTGTSTGCGPRSRRSTRCGVTWSRRSRSRRWPSRVTAEVPARGTPLRRPPRLRRAREALGEGMPASWSAGSFCRCWTASGASTSTRWTTSRRASACGRWPSATRSWSTSARATTFSRR